MKLKKVMSAAVIGSALIFVAAACGDRDPNKTANHVVEHMDDKAEDLELNAAQQAKYTAFRSDVEAAVRQGISERQAYKTFMRSEFKKDDTDMAAVTARVKSHTASRQASLDKSMTSFNEFYATLDAEQQKEVKKYMKYFVRRVGHHH